MATERWTDGWHGATRGWHTAQIRAGEGDDSGPEVTTPALSPSAHRLLTARSPPTHRPLTALSPLTNDQAMDATRLIASTGGCQNSAIA